MNVRKYFAILIYQNELTKEKIFTKQTPPYTAKVTLTKCSEM